MRIKKAIYSGIYRFYFKQYARLTAKNGKISEMIFRLCVFIAHRFFSKGFTAYLAKVPLKKPENAKRDGEKIIASLTTFPARIEQVWIAITTILLQSMPPDSVELWLAKEQFPDGVDALPDSLLRLREYGLEICFCEDLRSHKKYYGAMQNHPEDIVIIFDDDMFYSLDTIEKLMKLHALNPQDVVGMSTTKFSKTDFMNPLGWKMQNGVTSNKSTLGICGGSGTLFPPHSLHLNAFNPDAIRKLAPLADDQWLTAMTYMNGRKISSVGRLPFPVSVQDTQQEALTTTNNSSKSEINNNTQWKAILDYFQEDLQDWIKLVKENDE